MHAPGNSSIESAGWVASWLSTISERATRQGIELTGHRDALRGYGRDLGQGFLFSRPLPADDFVHFAQRHDNEEGLTRVA